MESSNLTTNALRGTGDEVSSSLEEANGSLTKTGTDGGIDELNGFNPTQPSYTTNSDLQNVTESGFVADQQTQDLLETETPEGDQTPPCSSGDNVDIGKDQTGSPASSARQEEELARPLTLQAKKSDDFSNQQTQDLPLTKAPEGDQTPPCSSDDNMDIGRDQTGSPASSAKREEELAHPLTVQAKKSDDSRSEDLSRNLPMIMAVLVVSVIIGSYIYFTGSNTRTDPRADSSVDIFRREFDKMKSSFPSQRAELWKRTKIHLERHLQTAEPTEPVSMILTSGHKAERTLHCLASRMAAAFSSALGASVLHIDGLSRASLESDQVKLDIDEQLTGAFEGDQKAAVVHRFEELPPGSTLIFYRYCDHENAAYKGAFLLFTVLLQEDDLKSHLSLSAVEEIVQDHIQDKFLSSVHPASFDKMDMDKLSGLWSRISHLILPVAAEQSIEEQGCTT